MTTMTAPLPSYDPFEADDPAQLLYRAGAESPLAWLPKLGSYLVSRHDDVLALLKDNRVTTATATRAFDQLPQADQDRLARARRSIDMWMGANVPEDHVRFQHLLKRYFTPSTVNGLRPRVRELTNELLDAVEQAGRLNIASDLGFPLPANIIAEMFGMPPSDRDLLRTWSRDILRVFQGLDMDGLLAGQAAMVEMEDYLRGIVAQRREDPRDDLITMFTQAEREGRVTEDEIVANCVVLLFAGHETTALVITHGMALLLDHPDQLASLRADPSRIPGAVEEIMRFDGPAKVVSRLTLEPLRIQGRDIPAGEHLVLNLGYANRDPRVFTDPDRFDITRTNNRHLGFAMGAYYCLGAALARVEVGECLKVVLERLPDLRPAGEREFMTQPPFGGRYTNLPVEF